MVESSIEREFRKKGYENIICLSSKELDLKNQSAVKDYFSVKNPEYFVLTAQKLLDVSALKKAGWVYKTELEEGIRKTYEWFLKKQ